jgi:uncharacterized protein YgbK (DUF1537 family)
MAGRFKIVVLDDDPTGSQTVHSCPLLLQWDQATLLQGLRHPSPLLFVLANTRALAPEAAAARVRAICQALKQAMAELAADGVNTATPGIEQWLIVSRGDSTLRGHFPLELEAISAELGPFDATFLVPAFLQGGRTTLAGVHLLHGEPVHTSAFARDGLFGYQNSFLPDWVAEKTAGRVAAEQVELVDLAALDGALVAGAQIDPAGYQQLCQRLAQLESQAYVAVDAERPQQLGVLAAAVRELTAPSAAERRGRPRRFLSQSAASWIEALAQLSPQPLSAAGLAALRRRAADRGPLPGLVLVGSHVPLADRQLEALLADPGCGGVEIAVPKVARVLEGPVAREMLASLEHSWLAQLEGVLAAGQTPVLFTSRGEVQCGSAAERRRLGLELAALMARLAAALAPRLGYLISKGGITTHTLLADGLGLARVELQGQLLPGLSLVLTPEEGPVPALPVLTFPGNLGDAATLRTAWQLMEGRAGSTPAEAG